MASRGADINHDHDKRHERLALQLRNKRLRNLLRQQHRVTQPLITNVDGNLDYQQNRNRRVAHRHTSLLTVILLAARHRKLRLNQQQVLPVLDERHKPCNRPVGWLRKQLDEDDRNRKHRHSDLSEQHNQLHPVHTHSPRLNLLHQQRILTLHHQLDQPHIHINRLDRHVHSYRHRTERLHRHRKPLNHNIPLHRIDRQLHAHKPTRRLWDIQLHAQQLDSRKLHCDSHGYEWTPQPPNHHNRLCPATATIPRLYYLSLITRADQCRPIRRIDDNRNSAQRILRNRIPHRYDTLWFDLRINKPWKHNRVRNRLSLMQRLDRS